MGDTIAAWAKASCVPDIQCSNGRRGRSVRRGHASADGASRVRVSRDSEGNGHEGPGFRLRNMTFSSSFSAQGQRPRTGGDTDRTAATKRWHILSEMSPPPRSPPYCTRTEPRNGVRYNCQELWGDGRRHGVAERSRARPSSPRIGAAVEPDPSSGTAQTFLEGSRPLLPLNSSFFCGARRREQGPGGRNSLFRHSSPEGVVVRKIPRPNDDGTQTGRGGGRVGGKAIRSR
jgi:hypothetical protein